MSEAGLAIESTHVAPSSQQRSQCAAASRPITSWLAVASLSVSLTSIVSLFGALLAAPMGAILGHIALSEMKRNESVSGRALALIGIAIGWLNFVLWLSLTVFMISADAGILGPEAQSWVENP